MGRANMYTHAHTCLGARTYTASTSTQAHHTQTAALTQPHLLTHMHAHAHMHSMMMVTLHDNDNE